ncbi:MAG: hypothetical protein KDN18_22005, partial [Verrucomicrobiae bacterium]|nr:hypothetical protein [Verrucomicrobiae bacterium]
MKQILPLLLLLLLPSLTQARLGDDLGTCVQRYGEPVSTGESGAPVVFRKDGLKVVAFFDGNGVVDAIVYSKLDPDSALNGTDAELLVSLNLGTAIRRVETISGPRWQNGSQTALGTYDSATGLVQIYTAAGLKRLEEFARENQSNDAS